LSVTTSSGHQTAREAEPGLFDHLVYFPIDVARFQLSAMQKVRPDVVAVMETELWMNCLWAAKVMGARTVLVNGRISDKNFRISRHLRFYYKALLKDMDKCLMQSQFDLERIQFLGAKDATVLGNIKFDQAVQGLDADPAEWKQKLVLDVSKPTLIFGSTRGVEEERLVIQAVKLVGADRVNVIHAPRHLERVDALAAMVREEMGSVALRSKGESGPYMILDTYGELSSIYCVADVVVIGGGFENLGGQNLIQPLAHGKPVLHGPHMQNFRDSSAMADACGAAQICSTADELAAAIRALLDDPVKRQAMGNAAKQLVQENLGATRRYAEAIAMEAGKAESR
jgi:3-deoxy-D-manno-octulosonic-acid transferase